MPAQLHPPIPPGGVAEQVDLASQLGDRVLAEPLKGSLRLGNESPDGGRDRDAFIVLAADRHTVTGQLRDPEGVLVGLGRQPGEEVQLHPPPSLGKRGLHRAVEILFPDQFVDDLAHPPGAGFGRERQSGAAHLLNLGGDAHGEGIDAEAGQADRDLAAAGRVVDDPADHLVDTGVVGTRQRRQADLVIAGAAQAVADHLADLGGRSFTDGTGDHARLAETTTARAASEDLDVEPVVHDLGHGNQLLLGVRPGGQVGDGPFFHPRRHVG